MRTRLRLLSHFIWWAFVQWSLKLSCLETHCGRSRLPTVGSPRWGAAVAGDISPEQDTCKL